jgi:outer membrane receptor protein involved in Fe transport
MNSRSPSSQTKALALTSAMALALLHHPLAAQDTPQTDQNDPAADDPPVDERDIIVRADRIAGQLRVEQAPVLELDAAEIEATGAESIAELVAIISPQTGSARGRGGGGRPVFLVNGIRIGSFRELRSYPPEAIRKVEVLPEEVAQKFGFPPDRRVINLILQDNYSSREIEAEYEQPGEGGYRAVEGEFTYLKLAKSGRVNFNAEVRDRTILTEAERDIIQTPGSIPDVAGDPDPALFRSLIADLFGFELTGNWAKSYLESGSSLSVNTTYERNEIRALSGLNTVLLTAPDGSQALRTLDAENPLEVRTDTDSISTSGAWNLGLGEWQLTTTLDGSVVKSVTEIDRRGDTSALEASAAAGTLAIDDALPTLGDAGFDTALTRTIAGEAKSVLRGNPIFLPAGDLATTFDVGYSWDRIESADTRSGSDIALTRGDIEAGINLVIPLTSRREGFADALGNFTLNAQAGLNHLSDFGTLTDWSTGLTWAPFDNLDLQATYTRNEVAPSLANLGNPQITTLNVPVFDFVNGETVLASVLSGGNPALLAETQSDWRFSANWELPFWENTRFTATYVRNRSDDVTSGFPALTPDIEAAFPSRVTRNAGGQLIALDRRPVTFDETRSERLVFGLTTRGSWGAARPRGSGRPEGAGRGGSGRPAGAGRPDGPAPRAGGPPSPEQRQQFMAFRERLCADDGMQMLTRLVDAVESGQDMSALIPGFDPERFKRILDRARGEDGKVDPERLARFRTRICSMDPSQMRGGRGGGRGGPQGASGQQAGQTQQAAQSGRPAGRGGARGGRGGRGGGMFGRDGRGRYFVNLNHTIELDNTILIAPGGPLLDQLAGETISNTGFSRHTTRLEAGAFRGGLGMRLSGFYTGKARVNGNPLTGSSPLFFSDLTRFNLRLFANLGTVLKKEKGVFDDLRISMRIDNVLNERRRVVDENGDTPINFQPRLLDPTGRYLGIELRKLF